jgi:hypothetical protein
VRTLLLLSLLAATPAHAVLLPIAASRNVMCGGDASASDPETGEQIAFDSDGDSVADGGFGLFDEVLGVSAGAGGAGVAGLARQTSLITPALVTYTDGSDLNASAFAPFSQASGVCESHLDFTFDVAGQEVWRVTASAAASNSGYAQMVLYRAAGTVFEMSSDFPFPVEEQITLVPGEEHQLTVYSQASGSAADFGTSDGIAGMTFRLEPVPEPSQSAGTGTALVAALVLARRSSRV